MNLFCDLEVDVHMPGVLSSHSHVTNDGRRTSGGNDSTKG